MAHGRCKTTSVWIILLAALGAAACGSSEDTGSNSSGGSGSASGAGSSSAGAGSTSTAGSGGTTLLPPPSNVEVEDYEGLCADRSFEGCYFVSNTGNYPPGTDGHQLTLDELAALALSPGDIVLFARGDTWRHTDAGPLLAATASGTEAEPIVYGAFGTGAPPRLLGSLRLDGWSNDGGNSWTSSTTVPSDPSAIDAGAEIFFERSDGTAFFGHHEASSDGLDRDGDWTFAGGTITVYAPSDPSALYASVEAPQAQRLIALEDQEHLVFDSLTLRYMVNAGIYDRYGNALGLRGLTLTRSEIAYIGIKNSASAYGLSLERSGVTIAGNDIHDCGRRSVSLVLYATEASVIRDVVIENNTFHHGYHTTGVDIEANTPSSGSHLIENITLRNNVFSSDPGYDIQGEDGYSSNLVFINQDDASVLRNIYIYGNVFAYAPGSAIKLSGGESYNIYNNTFFGFNSSYDNYQAHIFTGTRSRSVVIENNLFFNDAPDNRYACIELSAGREAEMTIDHNLYFAATYAQARLLWVDGGTSYFFSAAFADYVSATGFDSGSPAPADPLFVAAPGDLALSAGSPAIDAGVAVEWIEADAHGIPLGDAPDLGAFQFAP